MDLCDLITKHPKEIKSLAIEPVIRSGLKRFTDEVTTETHNQACHFYNIALCCVQVGRLWCSLADHFIRLGHLEKARDVYEVRACHII